MTTRKYGKVDLPEDWFRHQPEQVWLVSVFGGSPRLVRTVSFEGQVSGAVETWKVVYLLQDDELAEPHLVDTSHFIQGPLNEMETIAWAAR